LQATLLARVYRWLDFSFAGPDIYRVATFAGVGPAFLLSPPENLQTVALAAGRRGHAARPISIGLAGPPSIADLIGGGVNLTQPDTGVIAYHHR